MELTLSITFLLIIIILIVPFGLIWSLLIGKGKEYWAAVKNHPSQYLPKMKDQFVIFLSAGFLITALHWSGADVALNLVISDFKNVVGVHVFIVRVVAKADSLLGIARLPGLGADMPITCYPWMAGDLFLVRKKIRQP